MDWHLVVLATLFFGLMVGYAAGLTTWLLVATIMDARYARLAQIEKSTEDRINP